MSRGPIEIYDEAGVLRLKGESEPAIGSAGVQTAYTGPSTLCTNDDYTNLPFGDFEGPALLDITTPASPTFIEAGTYAVSLVIHGDDLTAGGVATIFVAGATNDFRAAGQAEHPMQQFGATAVMVAEAGDPLAAVILLEDGVADRNFQILRAIVVKL
jgi:hypothetical protein